MNDAPNDWKFTDNLELRRQNRLYDAPPFEDIVKRILKEMEIICFKGAQGYERDDCKRPEFKLKIPTETFDEFFNSPNGYRAQYYRSPEIGLEKNEYLIQGLSARLVAYAMENPSGEVMTAIEIHTSLGFSSAKVWLDEKEGDLDNLVLVEHICIPRWYLTRKNEILKKATHGTHAYEGRILKVMGALIDNDGEEYTPHSKKYRSEEIHRNGFT